MEGARLQAMMVVGGRTVWLQRVHESCVLSDSPGNMMPSRIIGDGSRVGGKKREK